MSREHVLFIFVVINLSFYFFKHHILHDMDVFIACTYTYTVWQENLVASIGIALHYSRWESNSI